MRLNLGGNEEFDGGSGSPRLVGFFNVDARPMSNVHYVLDIRSLPEGWLNSVDEIRASHVIEHMTYEDALVTVRHWAAVLKIGGLLRIYCPNFKKIACDYEGGIIDIDLFSRLVFGDQTYDLNLHRAAYDQDRLCWLVTNAGLKIVGTNPRPNAYEYDMGVQAIRVG